MIHQLSDDLASALAHSDGQPLRVEDPKTRRQYLIVPEDQWQPSPSSDAKTDKNGAWSDEKNARRFELIDKQIDGTITTSEQAELNQLTNEVDEYLERVAPLPLAALQALHDDLRQSLKARTAP